MNLETRPLQSIPAGQRCHCSGTMHRIFAGGCPPGGVLWQCVACRHIELRDTEGKRMPIPELSTRMK